MDFGCYRALEPNAMVPIKGDLAKAIKMLAPHLVHVAQARVVSVKRSAVLSIQDEVAVKVNAPKTEVANLQFVLHHTSLPVPKLFGLYRGEKEHLNFIVMQFVKGEPVSIAWPSLSPHQKRSITDTLKACFEELRQFSASYIGSADCGPLVYDCLEGPNCGPFRNEDELNDVLVKSFPRGQNYYASFVRRMLKSGHRIVLSHGDLALRNLMIYKGELSGIIDWEYAGFYPEYWDYALAFDDMLWDEPDYADWNECVQNFFGALPCGGRDSQDDDSQFIFRLLRGSQW